MNSVSLFLLSIFGFTITCADIRQEQQVKEITQELIQMAPLVQTCVLLVKNDMPVKKNNCIRVIQDFDCLLNELCRLQDEMFEEKK